jgi:type VI secretion system protein ImpF
MMDSLLDRLLDDEPEEARDPSRSDGARLEAMLAGLRRDLEGLLNTCRSYRDWADGEPSVIAFGLPDITTEDFGSDLTRARVARQITHCIQAFEPRLARIEVEFEPVTAAAPSVRFRIRAVYRSEAGPQAVEYGARVRPTDRSILVEDAR